MIDSGAPASIRLMNWMSPSFPIGAFGYSHGLEAAVASSLVCSNTDLFEWLQALIESGSARTEALLCSLAFRAEREGRSIDDLAELAEALAPGKERHKETLNQGKAFLQAVNAWDTDKEGGVYKDLAFPIALGWQAARHGMEEVQVVSALLNAFASNLIQAAIRLGVVGQSEGVKILAKLETVIQDAAYAAQKAEEGDLGSSAIQSDLFSLQHEALQTRLFLS